MAELRQQLEKTLSGSYTIERELGGGGMSRVFVAEETALGRKVVVKVLSPELAASLSAERFTRETRLAASLQQANIVPVLAAGTTAEGLPFYTMPFVEGESLRSRTAKNGLPPVSEVLGILRDVAKALAYAHEHGVVHRDIKPDNVLLSGGTAVVTDFGIAKALSAARTDAGGATLTQLGTSIGTPAYMAPEQAAGDPDIDLRADLYSLGAMAYELLSGRSPFHGRTPQRMMAAHMSEQPQPLAELRPDAPAALTELVMRCLAKDAAQRPQSASEIVRALDSVTSGGGMQAMPSILIGGTGMLKKALALYAGGFIAVAIVTRAAIIVLGLPDWVFAGVLIVMALGLPVILFTGYVHHVNRRIATATPTFTPGGTPSQTHGTMATLAVKATPHVSWRRTLIGGVWALGGFAVLVALFMVLRALGIGPAASLFTSGRLARNEKLLVADFATKGSADSTLGSVVSEALRADLSQSRVIGVVQPTAIRDALTRMRRPVSTRLDDALAREIAQREGVKAYVTGDITPLGAGFVVTARLTASSNGDELASKREVADSPRELIASVERLSRSLRESIGESLREVRATPSLEKVTTPSIDALRKYAEATRVGDIEGDLPRAAALAREAVALDTSFAMAWRKLAVFYSNAGLPQLRDSAITVAYRNLDRLSEFERLSVIAYYYGTGPGQDRARAIQAYEEALRFAPGYINNVALLYRERREFAKAESLLRARVASGEGILVEYGNLMDALYRQGKYSESDSVGALIDQRFPNRPTAPATFAGKLYRTGELDSLSRIYRRMRSSPNSAARTAAALNGASVEEVRGRLGTFHQMRAEMRANDVARGGTPDPYAATFDSAIVDGMLLRNPARAAARLDARVAKSPVRDQTNPRGTYLTLAIWYSRLERPDRARTMLAQYDAEQRDTTMRRVLAPARHFAMSEILLAEGKPLDAVREMWASDSLPDGPLNSCPWCLHLSLGRAYDRAAMADSAIKYYESFRTGPMPGRWFLDAQFRTFMLRRLGELYETRGDVAKAHERYAEFVDLWKNADPELQPQVDEIRRRMARLRDVERR